MWGAAFCCHEKCETSAKEEYQLVFIIDSDGLWKHFIYTMGIPVIEQTSTTTTQLLLQLYVGWKVFFFSTVVMSWVRKYILMQFTYELDSASL